MTNARYLALVGRAQQRDPIAETELFNALRPEVESQVRKTLRGQMFAYEDACADALSTIFVELPKFEDRGIKFLTWALTIADHTALGVLRQAGHYDPRADEKQVRLAERLEAGKPILPGSPKPKDLISTNVVKSTVDDGEVLTQNATDETAFNRWLQRKMTTDGQPFDQSLYFRITMMLYAMPEKTREVVELRIAGKSHDEIAAELGISSGNSRVRYTRAFTSIREALGVADVDEITRRDITNLAYELMEEPELV